MYSVAGKTVLVTGGAMGMGKLFSEQAVAEGAKVIIWDVNADAMKATAEELQKRGGEVYTYKVDVSDRKVIETNAAKVLKEHGSVDVLFNNAGIIVGANFWEHTNDQIQATMRINSEALMYIANAFLPGMMEKRAGRIVNFASAAGNVANPKMSVYCASKWAVIGWSDSLRLELEQAGYFNVCVTTVCPSYINTGMFDGVKAPLLAPLLEPGPFADVVWNAMKKGSIWVRRPYSVYLSIIFKALLPTRVFDYVVGQLFGVYKSMEDFKGHAAPGKTVESAEKKAA